ncbi:MAG: methyltransferase domain-containing protein [Cyclobacteriaceae bacterium]|nr:methyltransferase domain-containing protein [Cyclobacteriaceae bacterium]
MIDQLNTYYRANLASHGASAKGVGWKNEEAQQVRFEQLQKVIYTDNFSINDAGCGVGDLVSSLRSVHHNVTYRGYDLMPEMVDGAKTKFPDEQFFLVKALDEMQVADYSIASGILNLKFDHSELKWKEYILETIAILDQKSRLGFSFNALTKYSDTEFMKPELYYSDPLWLFDYCKIHFAKNVALLHDYSQYDFTILVKKNF